MSEMVDLNSFPIFLQFNVSRGPRRRVHYPQGHWYIERFDSNGLLPPHSEMLYSDEILSQDYNSLPDEIC